MNWMVALIEVKKIIHRDRIGSLPVDVSDESESSADVCVFDDSLFERRVETEGDGGGIIVSSALLRGLTLGRFAAGGKLGSPTVGSASSCFSEAAP
jgi:hypothetical protein